MPCLTLNRALALLLYFVPLLCAAPLPQDASPPGSKQVTSGDVREHLVKRVDPVYPPLAKAANIQGVVRFDAVITSLGTVTNLRLISGHPLLVAAAKDAVTQWRFNPFLEDGQPVPVRAQLDVPFSAHIPDAEERRQERVSKQFFDNSDACRTQYKAQQLTDAERSCETALQLVDQLPDGRRMERVDAHGLYGLVLLAEHRSPEALDQFKQELAIAETFLHSYDAELSYAHYHVAIGLQAIGHPTKALAEYKMAEAILTEAHNHISADFLKQQYSAKLKQMLQGHAELLKQTGDPEGAKQLEAEAAEIH